MRCRRYFNVVECGGIRFVGRAFNAQRVAGLEVDVAHSVPRGIVAMGMARWQLSVGEPACFWLAVHTEREARVPTLQVEVLDGDVKSARFAAVRPFGGAGRL